jgi:hypothetical protein
MTERLRATDAQGINEKELSLLQLIKNEDYGINNIKSDAIVPLADV